MTNLELIMIFQAKLKVVLADICIKNESDITPAGFTVIDDTVDTSRL